MRLRLHAAQFSTRRVGGLIMPVVLERIPEKKARPRRPVTRRWLIFGAAVLISGMGLTFLFWQCERSGPGFWLFALVLPVLIWGAMFTCVRIFLTSSIFGAENSSVSPGTIPSD